MKYFNGFCLEGEEIFFKEYLTDSAYTVAGFSYGAQKAFEYVCEIEQRVDRLILISPAFFQNHKKSFIKTQLRYFKADEVSYKENFLNNVVYPSTLSLDSYLAEGSYNELEALLSYVWDEDKIKKMISKGIIIEVFMGLEDKIVDAQKSHEFFSKLVPIYAFKDRGHLIK